MPSAREVIRAVRMIAAFEKETFCVAFEAAGAHITGIGVRDEKISVHL
jgi:hypothetical protein